jgi:hypothetical protein
LLPVSAQKATSSFAAAAASVTYSGYQNDQLFFSLKYENEGREKHVVTIEDADGVLLFTGVYTDKKFAKTFSVPAEAGNLTFTIRNAKTKEEKKFQVNEESRFTEEYSVVKINQQYP